MGLSGMLDGFTTATNLTPEQLEAHLEKYVPGYKEKNETERGEWRAANGETISKIKSNLGVLHFASDASGRNVDDVKSSVDNYLKVLAARNDDEAKGELEYADYEAYYQKTLTGAALEAFLEKTPAEKKAEVETNFIYKDGPVVTLGALELTAEDVVVMEKAAAGSSNTAGVSTLGSMYAIAAGYFNSDTYKNSVYYMEGYEPNFSDFGSFMAASSFPNFNEYYEAQGKADLDAYLNFMSYLSENPDADLSSDSAYSSQFGYIADALGMGDK